MKKGMTFDKAARVVLACLICALVLSVSGAMFFKEDDPVRVYLIIGSLAAMIVGIVTALSYCRCPSCGKRILIGMIGAKVCPACHRDLVTGAKVKANNRKR